MDTYQPETAAQPPATAPPRGAVIVRSDAQHLLSLSAALTAGYKCRVSHCTPDLLVTFSAKTLPFVVATRGAEDVEHLRQVVSRAEAVMATFRSCNLLLPSSTSTQQVVMDACARMPNARFIFMARGDDPVALAIQLAEQLHAATPIDVEQQWLNEVCSWEAMVSALEAIAFEPDDGQSHLTGLDARALSILRSLREMATSEVSAVMAATGLPAAVLQALDDFWSGRL